MKWVLLFAIKCYWCVIPPRHRRSCLFSLSCSRYVYAEARRHGLLAGLRACWFRFRSCRPGYVLLITPDQQQHVRLANGHILPASQLNEAALRQAPHLHVCPEVHAL
ncbi:MAG: membrane protein insertion efficiency factor YidD [Bacteroidetes bacterium]|nr:MAG: membrane protein insertion efficiency factor YidD [Bacteroidota bacterium]